MCVCMSSYIWTRQTIQTYACIYIAMCIASLAWSTSTSPYMLYKSMSFLCFLEAWHCTAVLLCNSADVTLICNCWTPSPSPVLVQVDRSTTCTWRSDLLINVSVLPITKYRCISGKLPTTQTIVWVLRVLHSKLQLKTADSPSCILISAGESWRDEPVTNESY